MLYYAAMQKTSFIHLWQHYVKPVIIGVTVIVAAVIIYLQSQTSTYISDTSASAFLKQYQQIAATHHSRYLDYEALCTENPPSRSGYFCHANNSQYRIYGVEDNQLYCADATGYRGSITTLPEGGFYCQAP